MDLVRVNGAMVSDERWSSQGHGCCCGVEVPCGLCDQRQCARYHRSAANEESGLRPGSAKRCRQCATVGGCEWSNRKKRSPGPRGITGENLRFFTLTRQHSFAKILETPSKRWRTPASAAAPGPASRWANGCSEEANACDGGDLAWPSETSPLVRSIGTGLKLGHYETGF